MQGITAEIMPILFAEVLNLTEMDYSEKLTEIPREDNIKSVATVRMEFPCCISLSASTI